MPLASFTAADVMAVMQFQQLYAPLLLHQTALPGPAPTCTAHSRECAPALAPHFAPCIILAAVLQCPLLTPVPSPLLQCYNISLTAPLTAAEAETLAWLLRETFEPELLTEGTEFAAVGSADVVVEVRWAGGCGTCMA